MGRLPRKVRKRVKRNKRVIMRRRKASLKLRRKSKRASSEERMILRETRKSYRT